MPRWSVAMVFSSVLYSLLALLLGTGSPLRLHRLFFTFAFSPRSVKATMLRVLVVVDVLLVTHTSRRLIFTPVVRLGRVDIALS